MNLFGRDPEMTRAFRLPTPGAGAGNRPPYAWGLGARASRKQGRRMQHHRAARRVVEQLKRMGF